MMTMALQQLDDKNPQEGASAIRTMVDIYDEKLFGHATFADFIDKMIDIARAAKPMNDFLNYTFEEYGEFPDRC